MAAPEYVPRKAIDDARVYRSPPWRREPWVPSRPSDLPDGQPRADHYGYPGPDQGYALTLAERFRGDLSLTEGEHEDDAIAGCVGVATKRASLLGRAPVIHDLTIAFTVWGFLDHPPPDDLVVERRGRFLAMANPHHYAEQRAIVDAVPDHVLLRTPAEVAEAHQQDWRSLLLL